MDRREFMAWVILGLFLFAYYPYTFVDNMGYIGYLAGFLTGIFYSYLVFYYIETRIKAIEGSKSYSPANKK